MLSVVPFFTFSLLVFHGASLLQTCVLVLNLSSLGLKHWFLLVLLILFDELLGVVASYVSSFSERPLAPWIQSSFLRVRNNTSSIIDSPPTDQHQDDSTGEP